MLLSSILLPLLCAHVVGAQEPTNSTLFNGTSVESLTAYNDSTGLLNSSGSGNNISSLLTLNETSSPVVNTSASSEVSNSSTSLNSSSSVSAPQIETPAPQRNATLIAVWLPVSFRSSNYEKLNNVLLGLADKGVRRVYLSVWSGGVAYFKSQYLKLFFTNKFSPIYGRDLLSWALAAAKPLGIEIIPWFELGFAGADARKPNGPFSNLARANDWIVGTFAGYEWMDPQNVDVSSVLSGILRDLLGTYGPLGVRTIHFGETLALPSSLGGVDTALAPVMNILRTALNQAGIDMHSPDPIRISLSPRPIQESRALYAVDWDDWATSDLIDEVVPSLVNYGSNLTAFEEVLEETFSSISKGTRDIIPAIGVPLFYPNGTYVSPADLRVMVDSVQSRGLGVCILDGFTFAEIFKDFVITP